jgi:hypothetical protein
VTDRTVGAYVLIALVDGVVGPGQEKKIASPILSNMYEGDIFGGPPVKLPKVLRRLDRPFFNITDDILRWRRRLQP